MATWPPSSPSTTRPWRSSAASNASSIILWLTTPRPCRPWVSPWACSSTSLSPKTSFSRATRGEQPSLSPLPSKKGWPRTSSPDPELQWRRWRLTPPRLLQCTCPRPWSSSPPLPASSSASRPRLPWAPQQRPPPPPPLRTSRARAPSVSWPRCTSVWGRPSTPSPTRSRRWCRPWRAAGSRPWTRSRAPSGLSTRPRRPSAVGATPSESPWWASRREQRRLVQTSRAAASRASSPASLRTPSRWRSASSWTRPPRGTRRVSSGWMRSAST
mmetsp:Transcript_10073/g.29754  ORF Transcript_10073/g.29754 Transcript_10073/m.29754 type:complete len:271 (+) Transcript_10073:606-1418(+)